MGESVDTPAPVRTAKRRPRRHSTAALRELISRVSALARSVVCAVESSAPRNSALDTCAAGAGRAVEFESEVTMKVSHLRAVSSVTFGDGKIHRGEIQRWRWPEIAGCGKRSARARGTA